MVSRRERLRAELELAIRSAAYDQIASGGIAAVSLKAIAAEVGMAGPSLYRYLTSRDELLADLVRESLEEIARVTETAAGKDAGRPAEQRLRRTLTAYWDWSRAHPGKYELCTNLAGTRQITNPDTIVAIARRPLNHILDLTAQLNLPDLHSPPASPKLITGLKRWGAARGRNDLSPAALQLGARAWTRLHGLIDLDAHGVFRPEVLDPDELFAAELDALLACG